MILRPVCFPTVFSRNIFTKLPNNGKIKPVTANKNPRNLERLRLARKPLGYAVDDVVVEFWHKLEIIPLTKHVVAQLVHYNSNVVVQASTSEWGLQKHLYSLTDKQAYIILAKVFAERCQESGLTSFYCNEHHKEENSKIQAFCNVLIEEGLSLEEPPCYNPHDIWRKKPEKKPWTVLED